MTRFVESFATKQLLPPWVSEGSQSWAFIVEVPAERVQNYLDHYFNGAYPDRAPYIYTAAPDPQYGVMMVTAHARAYSAGAIQSSDGQSKTAPVGWDTVRHTEVYWAVPVQRRTITPDNLLVDPTTVWVQPFVFDDNAVAVFGAREIWGSEMGIATIVREGGLPAPEFHLDVAVHGIKVFSPRSRSELLACMHIHIPPDAAVSLDEVLAANKDLAPLLSYLDASWMFSGDARTGSQTGEGLQLNNLKQFRDAYNLDAAIYRAIIAAESSHSNVDRMTFYSGKDIALEFIWSDSIAEMVTLLFGVTEEMTLPGPPPEHAASAPSDKPDAIVWEGLRRAPLKVALAFSCTSDVRFEVKSTLHTYGG